MISCSRLTKTFQTARGPVTAVRDIDFEAGEGEAVAIIGRSGSGKSTLVSIIGGLLRPTSGRVMISGIDLWDVGDDQRTRLRNRRIGFAMQATSLLPTLTLIDNVALPALVENAGNSTGAYAFADHLIGRLGLAALASAFPHEMSLGEQRRGVIARALVNAPPIILADEPTADLDGATEAEVVDVLFDVSRHHRTTLVLVTHSAQLADRADRSIEIESGALVA